MSGDRHDPRTVLIVDDHEDIRDLLSLQLRAPGCRVVAAGNGEGRWNSRRKSAPA